MQPILRMVPHTIVPGRMVVEVWYADHLLATVVPCEGPGIRVISKLIMSAEPEDDPGPLVALVLQGQIPRALRVTFD